MLIGDLLIQLTGEDKSFTEILRQAQAGLVKIAEQSNKTTTQLEELNKNGWEELKKGTGEAAQSAKALEPVLQKIDERVRTFKGATQETGASLRMLSQGFISSSASSGKLINSLKAASNDLWLMTMGLQQFGRAMSLTFTAPFVAAIGASTKLFMEWEKGTVSIQRAAEISRVSANQIADNFIKISQNAPITVKELQEAGYAAAQAGVTGVDAITNFAKAAVMLSKVGGDAFRDLPVTDLANNLAKLSIAFGETGKDMDRVTNIASMLLGVAKSVPGGLGKGRGLC